jgi:hypothetical protein
MILPVTTKERDMTTSSIRKTADTRKAKKHDQHFYELLDLASEGREEAIQGLWAQFGYDFAKEGRGDE